MAELFNLDANGNRLGSSGAAAPPDAAVYRPASDQALDLAGRRSIYNAVGEPIKIEGGGQTRTLAYGSLGELVSVSDNGKPVAAYRYNPNRQRIAKTVNGRTTFFLWQGGAIAAEANARGHIEKRYVYMGSRPVALIEYDASGKAGVYAIHSDHLGTPLQVTDMDKRIVWQAEYAVYGKATVKNHSLHVAAGPPGNGFIASAHASVPASFSFNLRLPGQYEDAETGWHYNFHCYYNPDTGRYLTPDPIGLQGGTNLYAYVDGDPAGAGDPWGLKVWLAEKKITGVPLGLAGHIWIIIEPDNKAELDAMLAKLGITYTTSIDNPNRITLGAYPDEIPNSDSQYGLLKKNMRGDYANTHRQLFKVSSPNYGICFTDGHSYDTQFIVDLLQAYYLYKDNLPYDPTSGDRTFPYNLAPLPAIKPSVDYYNSNSFAAGILHAAGVTNIPNPNYAQPGIEKPVPLPSTIGGD